MTGALGGLPSSCDSLASIQRSYALGHAGEFGENFVPERVCVNGPAPSGLA